MVTQRATSTLRNVIAVGTVALAAITAALGDGCAVIQTGDSTTRVTTWRIVSGEVEDSSGSPIAGVTISANAGGTTDVTGGDGSYAVRVPYNWSGVLTVQHIGYTIIPENPQYAHVTADFVQSFVALPRDTADVNGDAGSSQSGHNTPPVANAGADQSVTDLEGDGYERVTLDASGSTDSDGVITQHLWLENGEEMASGVVAEVDMAVGAHVVTLVVFDNAGASDNDSVVITVMQGNLTVHCEGDTDCNDGLFCNGVESCIDGRCEPGTNPCRPGEVCDEAVGACNAVDPDAWVPPIGIPVPQFGVRENAPSPPEPWDSPTLGFYYIDQYHSKATDSANPYGSPSRPRATIPRLLPAGAVVTVIGRYEHLHASARRIISDGTPESPVFIRGASMSVKAHVTRDWELGGHYLIIENLSFADDDGDLSGGSVGRPQVIAPAHHIALRHCEVSGNLDTGGVGLASWTSETADNIVIYGNLIHHNGDWQATYDQDRHGIAVGRRVSYVWVLDNEMHHNSGDGIQINGDSTTHHIYVGRNLSWQNKQTGFWCKTAHDVVFSQNEAHSHAPSGSSPGAGMGWQYDGRRIWFLYNHLHDNTLGFRGASSNEGGSDEIYMIGNLIHSTTDWAVEVWSADPNVYIVNNTIVGAGGGIKAEQSRGLQISNNIIASVGSLAHVAVPGSLSDRAHMDHCLLHAGEGWVAVQWGSDVYHTVRALQGIIGQCQGCREGDALFVDVREGDFHLMMESPAIDGGVAHDAYARFAALYGIDISVDMDGNPRGQGKGYDIGAYEHEAPEQGVRHGQR